MKLKKLFCITKFQKFNFSQVNLTKENIIEKSKINMYRGIELDLEQVIKKEDKSENIKDFEIIMQNSLTDWEKDNIRSITVRIPSYLSNYITFFMDRGFYFHHTNSNNLFLCKWLDKLTHNKIPRFAHHHVGVAACILNKNMELLLIKEKFGPSYTNQPVRNRFWKFVTGLIEEGESVVEACHREVKEEVSMEVDYHGCVIISESYPNYQKISDICFFNLCSVKGETDYENIKIDEDELSQAKFFKIEEVEKLMEDNQTTVLTVKTLKKLIPILNFKKSLEENLIDIKEKGLFTRTELDLSAKNFSTKYLNVYH
jgi:ADP-ribose pyrophosphatase YjhB (NUDIX family)